MLLEEHQNRRAFRQILPCATIEIANVAVRTTWIRRITRLGRDVLFPIACLLNIVQIRKVNRVSVGLGFFRRVVAAFVAASDSCPHGLAVYRNPYTRRLMKVAHQNTIFVTWHATIRTATVWISIRVPYFNWRFAVINPIRPVHSEQSCRPPHLFAVVRPNAFCEPNKSEFWRWLAVNCCASRMLADTT